MMSQNATTNPVTSEQENQASAQAADADRDAFEKVFATQWHRERNRTNETVDELLVEIKSWRNGASYDDDLPRLKFGWEGYQWALQAITQHQQTVERMAFEAFMLSDTAGFSLERDGKAYKDFDVSVYWHIWQGRAALATHTLRGGLDLQGVEIAALKSTVGHLSALVEEQREQLTSAKDAMTALHNAARPADESNGDTDAVIPYNVYARFADAHAVLIHALASGQVGEQVPVATQVPASICEELDNVLTDPDSTLSPGAVRALRWMRSWVSVPLYTCPEAPQGEELTQAARDVLAERARQINAKGWTPERDDAYNPGVLSEAGSIYALHAFDPRRAKEVPEGWPWVDAWWKPSKSPRRNLEKACALILAEIERYDRVVLFASKQPGA